MTCLGTLRALAGVAVALAVFFAADIGSPTRLRVSTAEARVGRPATPMSYAGVARRTVRRGAYAAGATAVGAAAVGAAAGYYGSGCSQTTDAYGRLYTTCR
jgi:hypothetical protein